MSLWERLAELGKSMLTTDAQLNQLQSEMDSMQQQVHTLSDSVQDVRERVTRLEAAREADRAQMATEIERFKLEVERAELRLSRQLPTRPASQSEEQ